MIDKEIYEFGHASWNNLSNFYKILNQNEIALKFVNKGLNLLNDHPDNYALIDTKAEIYYELSDLNHSIELYSKILELDQDDIRVKKLYAETCWKASKSYHALERKEKAQELLRKASLLVETYCKNEKIKNLIKNDTEELLFKD